MKSVFSLSKRASSLFLSLSERSIKRLCSIDFLDLIRHKIAQQVPDNTHDTSQRRCIRHKSAKLTGPHSHLLPVSRISSGDWWKKQIKTNPKQDCLRSSLYLRGIRICVIRIPCRGSGWLRVTSNAARPIADSERDARRGGSAPCRSCCRGRCDKRRAMKPFFEGNAFGGEQLLRLRRC